MREIYFNVSEAGCQDSPVLIGYEGENEVTRVNVDYSEWIAEFGPGSLALEVMRSGDTAPYLATLTKEGDNTYWLVSNVDTGARGTGAAGFVYTVGSQIKKSAVFRFFVGPDVGGTPGERPDPYESLISYIERLLARTEANAAAAAESAQDAADEAGKAETARQAVEDLGVTAHEDPNGPSVEKSVDPETGAVTLDFGLTPVSVSAVNGQTGAVTLDLDDIPNGAQYARTTPAQVQQISTNENDIEQLQTGKQNKITASGILKGDGAGGITAAVAGTDFVAPSALNAYRTASDQTAIDNAQNTNINNNTDAISVINAKIPTNASESNKLTDESRVHAIANAKLSFYRTAAAQDSIDAGKQSKITASGVLKGDGSGGVSSAVAGTDYATPQQVSEKYTKPADGIPSTDMTADVQASLSKAESALQAVPDTYRTAADQDTIDAGKQAKITATGILKGDGAGGVSAAVAGEDYITGLEILSYGNSTWADFLAAYTANKVVYCRASSNTNPASGDQTRLAFMAYVNNADNPTNVEFQYYRSIQTHSDSQQGDQVFVYKLDKTAGWTVTTRNTFTAVDVGTGLSKAYANGKLTLSVDGYRTAADQDVIDDAQDERLDAVEQTTTATTIGPVALATFEASAADMPLKGLTANIVPVQSGSGDPSPDNVRPITALTGCKLHHTGISLIGGDAFVGNTFSKTAAGYKLSYNGSSISSRASAFADIRGLPAGRYTIAMLNPSYPSGAEVNIRRSTAGSTVTMGVIIGDNAYGRRTYNIPENTTSLQLYIIPGTVSLNTDITMDDLVLVRESDESEPYKGNTYNITFPTEAGTVYGGTLDVVNRKLNSYPYYSSYNGETIIGPWISSMDVYTPGATPTLGAQVVDMGGAATSYDLSDVPEITTLLGENNIWANRGDVTVTYGAYLETVKAYADQVGDSILNAIAPLETSYTASRNYAIGSFLFVGTKFYKVSAAISSGDTITPDTNVTQTTVAEQLMALAN